MNVVFEEDLEKINVQYENWAKQYPDTLDEVKVLSALRDFEDLGVIRTDQQDWIMYFGSNPNAYKGIDWFKVVQPNFQELYDKYERIFLEEKQNPSKVKSLFFKSTQEGEMRLLVMINGVPSQQILVANKGGWKSLYSIADNGLKKFHDFSEAKDLVDQFSDRRCQLWTDGRFEKTKLLRIEGKNVVKSEKGVLLEVLSAQQWAWRVNKK